MIQYFNAERWLVGMHPIIFPQIFDLKATCQDKSKRRDPFHGFRLAGEAASRDGAEVFLAAGGVVVALLSDSEIDQLKYRTLALNGITALIKQSEVAIHSSGK
jgi:hypothetical protein